MKSYNLKFYLSSFLFEKNKVIDSIEDFLAPLPHLNSTSKPFPLTLNQTVVLPFFRDDVALATSHIYNYLKIEVNDDEEGIQKTQYYYYFINKIESIANDACRCQIEMDVAQTILKNSTNFTSILAEKPFIYRQHKDRFLKNYTTSYAGVFLYRKIDETSEGLTPTKFLNSKEKLSQEYFDDDTFCLVYIAPHYYKKNGEATEEYAGSLTCTLKTKKSSNIPLYSENGIMKTLGELSSNNSCFPWASEAVSKIISLPYCPVKISKNSDNTYLFDTFLSTKDTSNIYHNLKYNIFSEKFGDWAVNFFSGILTSRNDTLITENVAPTIVKKIPDFKVNSLFAIDFEEYLVYKVRSLSFTKIINRFIEDSKLYHSDFFGIEYKFDTSSISFDLEKLEYTESSLPKIEINYYVSSELNSSIMFEFNFTQGSYKFNSEYDKYLVCNYSGELALYNDSFLNYLRNGYNYDLKEKEQNTRQNVINTFLNVGKATAGLAVGAVTGGVGLAVGVGTAFSGVSQIYNSIESEISSQRSLERKLSEGSLRNVTISGNVDTTFREAYSNKLTKYTYTCTDKIKEDLNELFFRYGYAVNRYEEIDLKSRIWRNFISGKFKFKNMPSYLSLEMKDKLDNLLGEGITFYHSNLNATTNKKEWDFYGTYENWESFLFDEGE